MLAIPTVISNRTNMKRNAICSAGIIRFALQPMITVFFPLFLYGLEYIGLKEHCRSSKVLAARDKVLSRAWYWLEFSWVSMNYSEAYVINLSDAAPRIGGGTFYTSTYDGTPYVALCH